MCFFVGEITTMTQPTSTSSKLHKILQDAHGKSVPELASQLERAGVLRPRVVRELMKKGILMRWNWVPEHTEASKALYAIINEVNVVNRVQYDHKDVYDTLIEMSRDWTVPKLARHLKLAGFLDKDELTILKKLGMIQQERQEGQRKRGARQQQANGEATTGSKRRAKKQK
jgi:predicted transcriptional regulator